MKASSLTDIKKALQNSTQEELLNYLLYVTKYKLENKEVLSYLLFDAIDENAYVKNVQKHIEEQFLLLKKDNAYVLKKGLRKILRSTKKYAKYSKQVSTEVSLMLFYCDSMSQLANKWLQNTSIQAIYNRELLRMEKLISKMHEDLQFDSQQEMEEVKAKFLRVPKP